jgi:hypothetical protein
MEILTKINTNRTLVGSLRLHGDDGRTVQRRGRNEVVEGLWYLKDGEGREKGFKAGGEEPLVCGVFFFAHTEKQGFAKFR